MAQENPEPEVMEAEAADEQAENPDFVPVEEAPAEEPTPEPAPMPAPVLFPDVYAAASQAFADSRANIAAKEKAIADNGVVLESLTAERLALMESRRKEDEALDVREADLAAHRTGLVEQRDAALVSDKEAARALIAVLQSYVA